MPAERPQRPPDARAGQAPYGDGCAGKVPGDTRQRRSRRSPPAGRRAPPRLPDNSPRTDPRLLRCASGHARCNRGQEIEHRAKPPGTSFQASARSTSIPTSQKACKRVSHGRADGDPGERPAEGTEKLLERAALADLLERRLSVPRSSAGSLGHEPYLYTAREVGVSPPRVRPRRRPSLGRRRCEACRLSRRVAQPQAQPLPRHSFESPGASNETPCGLADLLLAS